MNQIETEDQGDETNYRCDVCGAIYPNPVAAVRHVFNSSTGDHGEESEIPPNALPSRTTEPVNTQTARDAMEQSLADTFDDPDILVDIEKTFDGELPTVLSEHDMETLSILQMDAELHENVNILLSELRSIQTELATILGQYSDSSGPATPTLDTDEEEDEEEDDDEYGGSISTAERMRAEREQVMQVLQRGGFLDEIGDEAYDIFEEIYTRRDENENPTPDVLSEARGLPVRKVEERLDALSEMGLIEHDTTDDSYYYSY